MCGDTICRMAREGSDETRVVAVFRQWLATEGWTTVAPTDPWTDIEAIRGDERLIGEAKGRTTGRGLDADTLYGQLLRRMTFTEPTVRYAAIVPTSSIWHIERVPASVRQLLRIDVYEVTDDDQVRPHPA